MPLRNGGTTDESISYYDERPALCRAGYILGVSADAARKMRTGDIKSLKLQAALRLARELKVPPWYLAGEAEPAIPLSAGPPGGSSGPEEASGGEPGA